MVKGGIFISNLRIFKNEEFGKVRTVELDGQPFFVGRDIATALGYSNPRDALRKHVDEEDKNDAVAIRDTIGREQKSTIINESGLYSLVLSSKLPSAKKFKRWVTTEVLPSIRKTGSDSEQSKGVVTTPNQYGSNDMVDANDSGQHGLVLVNEQNDEQVVSGRALHQFLGVETRYNDWFKRMLQYGFEEGKDYVLKNEQVLSEKREREYTQVDHILKLDMAKELCMLARSEKGKQARRYFLELEREWNSPEKVMARALKIAQQKLTVFGDRIKLLEADAERMRPKEIFADAVTGSSDTIPVGELAKILRQNGYRIGRNRLFDWMRENGYLIQRAGDSYNCPTQKAMDMGLFEIKETVVTHSDGTVSVYHTSKVTGKGQIYFVHKFSKGVWCA